MPAYQRFFAELKRREVFRVAAVYGATGFVVLQVVDLLAEGLALPEVVLRTATVLVLFLLGVNLLAYLAWSRGDAPATAACGCFGNFIRRTPAPQGDAAACGSSDRPGHAARTIATTPKNVARRATTRPASGPAAPMSASASRRRITPPIRMTAPRVPIMPKKGSGKK